MNVLVGWVRFGCPCSEVQRKAKNIPYREIYLDAWSRKILRARTSFLHNWWVR